MRSIAFYDTTLRDSTHTLRKSPMSSDELAPLAEMMDGVGFAAVEVWGGATVEVCLRHLGEDPWDRLVMFGERLPKSPLRILIRGQNLLGYRPMPEDLIRAFAREVARKGVRIARIFDSLNDTENLEPVINAFKENGIQIEGALVYTQSPVHSVEGFIEAGRRLVELGANKLVIADNSGILTPGAARALVPGLARHAPVLLHVRSATGMAPVTYVAAIQAGAHGVDCTVAPFGLYSTLPSVESVMESLDDKDYSVDIDRKALRACAKRAEEIAVQHAMSQADRQLVENAIVVHKISIGMLSSLIEELKALNAQHRLKEVLSEITRVREDFGWPPLITPISQMVTDQAVRNVVRGQRYTLMSREVTDYLKGMYGRPPGEVAPELLKGITPVSGRASNLLPPVMESTEKLLRDEGLYQKPEDVITAAQFGRLAMEFFRRRKNPSAAAPSGPSQENRLKLLTAFMEKRNLERLEIAGEDFRVKLVKESAYRPAAVAAQVEEAPLEEAAVSEDEKAVVQGEPVLAPLSGVFYRSSAPGQPSFVEVGMQIEAGTVVGLIEAMKLFHEVKAEKSGKLLSFAVENAQDVDQDAPVVYLETE